MEIPAVISIDGVDPFWVIISSEDQHYWVIGGVINVYMDRSLPPTPYIITDIKPTDYGNNYVLKEAL